MSKGGRERVNLKYLEEKGIKNKGEKQRVKEREKGLKIVGKEEVDFYVCRSPYRNLESLQSDLMKLKLM